MKHPHPTSFNLETLPSTYQPQALESNLYIWWEEQDLFNPDTSFALAWQARGQEAPSNPTYFSMVIPPPNVTGTLHMGHALDNTIQDIFTRYHRMLGHKTLWMPGTDHAGIATQAVVERRLLAGDFEGYPAGTRRTQLDKETFLELCWQWAKECQHNIVGQFKRLGISPDWNRQRFTLDEGLNQAVRETFISLYERGYIYRGEYIVNWDPATQSAISDIEVDYTDEESFLWHIAYPLVHGGGELVVATTRPETLYGDVAVAVNPNDERYARFIGQHVILPLTGKTIPVIGDNYVEIGFGTGCLKITPAHDPNDFQVGKRHQLTPLRVFDDAACLLPLPHIPPALHGVNRWEARQQTETLLEGQGYLRAKQPHQLRVGKAQRSGEVVEPLLSKQWFVKTAPLAKACLEALEAGQLHFVPERWTKDYLRWMSHIEDWCISRQLWWGHSVPAWHHKTTKEIYVGLTPPADIDHWEADTDVLDTWFSSGLWPFSTLGWPNTDAADYQQYYPTSMLVTGFDIIFFWVARMCLFGHEMTGSSPFETVYIHGLIRDEKGQKMSKSKGNTIDPVVVIDEQGCDGFRFALTSLITYGGQDIKLSKDKLEQGRLFANKLWNASRFVMLNLASGDIAPTIQKDYLSDFDKWILGRYEETLQQATSYLEQHRLGEYANLLLEFVWYQFCDWYVEYAKFPMKHATPEVQANVRAILYTVLEGLLCLLHPIMPYITEALWQQLPVRDGQKPCSISISPFPQAGQTGVAPSPLLDQDMDYFCDVVRALRNGRQQYMVPPSKAVDAIIEAPEAQEYRTIERMEPTLRHFVALEALTLVKQLTEKPANVATNVVAQTRVMISLEGLIDPEQEKQRLYKKQETLQKEQQKLLGMLSNEGFLQRAPEAVILKNREQLAELNLQLQLLAEQLTNLA